MSVSSRGCAAGPVRELLGGWEAYDQENSSIGRSKPGIRNGLSDCADMAFSAFNVKLKDAPIFPSYVTMLVRAADRQPETKQLELDKEKNERVFMLQYNQVSAVEASAPKNFKVEVFCQLQQMINFNMCDRNVHLLIGKVNKDDEDGSITVVAEKIFKLTSEKEIEAIKAERDGMASAVLASTKKRAADGLVEETPAKRRGRWEGEVMV